MHAAYPYENVDGIDSWQLDRGREAVQPAITAANIFLIELVA